MSRAKTAKQLLTSSENDNSSAEVAFEPLLEGDPLTWTEDDMKAIEAKLTATFKRYKIVPQPLPQKKKKNATDKQAEPASSPG